MADKLIRAQVSIPLDSNNPEDAIVNTWHFDGDDDNEMVDTDYTDLVYDMLVAFYDAIGPTIFPTTVGSVATIKQYDLRDAEPRVPESTRTFSIETTTDPPLPNEVALCLSFAAENESGVAPARRRGRIYLGPIAESVGEVVVAQLRPTAAARNVVAAAAATLQDGMIHRVGSVLRTRWAVYSPRTHQVTGDIGAAFNDVLTGWIDNAFDTQRRRGPVSTARTVFP